MLKISKSGPEPAARAARKKTRRRHNASARPAEASDAGPAEAAEGLLARPAKGAKSAKRRIEVQAPPVQAHAPALSGGFKSEAALPALETASRARENGPARAWNAAKRAAGATVSVARPRLGPAGRKLLRWLKTQYGDDAIESVKPLCAELLAVADRLADVRRMLADPALTVSERLKLMRTEVQLNGSFARCWRLLGLADDAPTALPRGRPPRPE
jgi:hypothetical protein